MPNLTEEKSINSILFKLAIFVTVAAALMMLIEFFTRGIFPPTDIGTFYIGVLVMYALHKEALRWLEEKGKEGKDRKGEYFVYFWIMITALLYLVNFFSKGFFTHSPTGAELETLSKITLTALEVSAIFIITRILKIGSIWVFGKEK